MWDKGALVQDEAVLYLSDIASEIGADDLPAIVNARGYGPRGAGHVDRTYGGEGRR